MDSVLNEDKSYKRPVSVLILVYTKERQVLLLRRIKPDYFWQSVAGSLEWDETPAAAAQRELYEETGLSAKALIDCKTTNVYMIYPMWRHRYAPGVVENTEYVFRLQLDAAAAITLDAREHSEYQWVDQMEALTLVVSHTNRDAIQKWV